MICKEPTKKGDKVKITFVLPAQAADGEISVAGDFNSWSLGQTVLRGRDGVLAASLVLVAGRRYAFRYCRDGRWFDDEDADAYEYNDFGDKNGIIDLT